MLKINHRRLFRWKGSDIPSLSLSLAIPLSAAVSAFSVADLSIEQFMSLPVTSVSKKAQNFNDAVAAIAVLTADDLHRSGTTSLADALRLVPGMQVPQIDSSQWSISSRGFSGQYANKLLVMVDGRTVYTPSLAVSRAVRTPNVLEGSDTLGVQEGSPFTGRGGTYVPRIVGGDPDSEILWSYELGYRIQPAGQIHVDAAIFYNNYDRIININNGITALVPGTPADMAEVPLINAQNGTTYGGESALTLEPLDHWRLTASYPLLRADLRGENPPNEVIYDDPQQQVVPRSAHDFGRMSIDAQVRAVDQAGNITADMRLAYRLRQNLEVSITGQNLLDAGRRDANRFFVSTNGVVPRGVYGRVIRKF